MSTTTTNVSNMKDVRKLLGESMCRLHNNNLSIEELRAEIDRGSSIASQAGEYIRAVDIETKARRYAGILTAETVNEIFG